MEKLAILHRTGVLCIPKEIVEFLVQQIRRRARCFRERNYAAKILRPEHFIHDFADVVEVFIGDLDEDAAAGMEEVAGEQEAVAQAGGGRRGFASWTWYG